MAIKIKIKIKIKMRIKMNLRSGKLKSGLAFNLN